MLLIASMNQNVQSKIGDMSSFYKGGQSLAHSIPFMGEMLITGGVFTATRKAVT